MFELALRVVFSLAAVLGLLWLLARLSAKRLGGNRGSVMTVVGRQSVGRNASLAVVSVGDRVLVVGVSEQGVRLLTELDPEAIEEPVEPLSVVEDVRVRTTAPAVRTNASRTPKHQAPSSGSVLAPQTWRQAWMAVSSRNGSQA